MGINIGGDDVTDVTIDGSAVKEITMDGDVVYLSVPPMLVVNDMGSGHSVRAHDLLDENTEWTDSRAHNTEVMPEYSNEQLYSISNDILYALDYETGSELWTVTLNEDSGQFDTPDPCSDGSNVYVSDGGSGDTFSAYNITDGSLEWSVDLNTEFSATSNVGWASPAVHNGTVYVGNNAGCIALDASTGSVKWIVDDQSINGYNVVTATSDLCIVSGGNFVTAYMADSGDQLWRHEDTALSGDYSSTVHGNSVYVGLSTGIVKLAADTGDVQWTYTHSSSERCLSPPAVYNGTLYAPMGDFTVQALAVSDGTVQWTSESMTGTGEPYRMAPVVWDGTVYAGAWEGPLYAFNTSDGTTQWTGSGATGEAALVLDEPADWQFRERNQLANTDLTGTWTNTTSVTSDNAPADGSQTNQWTVSITHDGSPVERTQVNVVSGYDEDTLGGISAGDRAYTDANGDVTFTATAELGGNYTLGFNHSQTSEQTATSTFEPAPSTITATVTSDNAPADGSTSNEWTVHCEYSDGTNYDGATVEVQSVGEDGGGTANSLDGISVFDTATTDSNGDAIFTATNTEAEDVTIQFGEPDAGTSTATATYTSPITVKEDWESIGGGSESLDDNYFQEPTQFPSNPPGTDWEVQSSTAYEQTYALHGITGNSRIGAASGTGRDTSNGTEYLTHVSCNSGGWATVLFHIQNPDVPLEDGCFYGVVNQADGWIRSGGKDTSNNYLNLQEANYSIQANTEYILGCEATSSGVTVTLYDTSMSQLATVTASNTNFTSGTLGFWTRNADTYYDYTHHE